MGNFEMGFENKRIELKLFPSLKSNCSLFYQYFVDIRCSAHHLSIQFTL